MESSSDDKAQAMLMGTSLGELLKSLEAGAPSAMYSSKVVAEAWDNFRRITIHPDAGPTQLNETRKSFYGGALTILTLLRSMPEEIADETAAAALNAVWLELVRFAMQLPDNGPGGLTSEELKVKAETPPPTAY